MKKEVISAFCVVVLVTSSLSLVNQAMGASRRSVPAKSEKICVTTISSTLRPHATYHVVGGQKHN